MVASIEFPFTNAQWKELERQAMIYKYMVASVPVPPHLLSPPNFINFGSNGLGSRLRSGGSNLESGRCKRTDGKEWRCSRDAAPDQKYCDRHLHRGRPCSRKRVELFPIDNVNVINLHLNAKNYKKTRLVTVTELSASGFPSNRAGSSWQLAGAISEPYCQNHASIIKSEKKTCDSDSPFILPYNQPRALWFSRAVARKMTGLVQVVVMLIFRLGQLAICGAAPNLDEQITMLKLQSSRTTHPQLPT